MIAFSILSIIDQCCKNTARGMLTVLVTKSRTMKPDEGTSAVSYTLEEEKIGLQASVLWSCHPLYDPGSKG